jgi:predicted Zn-dependent protease
MLCCLVLATLTTAAGANNPNALPDIGSPSDAILNKQLEARIGRQVYYSLLNTGSVITDPETQEYIQAIGMRLVAASDTYDQRFRFFVINNPVINAFALPGGYIGIHSGLLLSTANESELAGVLAHEISHVTQRHISRAVFANSRNSTLSMAGMLGAILVGVVTGSPDIVAGGISATQGAAIEQQIKFTRSNEYEADRVGIGVLADAGFDPMGMPAFFETMGRQTGSLSGNRTPEFLLTHPVSSDRMAESRARARKYPKVDVPDSNGYKIARARIRLLTSRRPELALEQFSNLQRVPAYNGTLEIEYGLAIANIGMRNFDTAERSLKKLLADYEEVIPLYSALGLARMDSGNRAEALKTFENALKLFPRNVPLTVYYCDALLRDGQAKKAHKILLELLNRVPPTLEQVRLIAIAANKAGDLDEAYFYMAEYHAMNGNLRMAIDQLKLALATPGVNNVQKARYKARLEQFTSYLPTKGK